MHLAKILSHDIITLLYSRFLITTDKLKAFTRKLLKFFIMTI